jgi:hypothetical protein
MPELTPVESSRFQAWHYDQRASELYVQYPPSKKQPHGVTCVYSGVAPEVYDEGQEAESKGAWLYEEIISKPTSHPFRVIELPPAESREEFEADRMGQTGADNGAKLRDEIHLVPEPIRAIAVIPEAPAVVMPQILPPDVREGDKPFNQVVRERALAVAAAVPATLRVTSADAYKALGSALVVIQTERRAVDKALDLIAKPVVEAKRNYDAWRNEVLAKYDEAERRLNAALQTFKRAEEQRVREEEARARRENEARARRVAEEAAEGRRKQQAEEARLMAESARQRLTEAQAAIAAPQPQTNLFGLEADRTEAARAEVARAQADLQQADVLAQTPVTLGPIFVAPAVVARPDLKVAGLRSRPPLWRWRILPRFFRSPDLAPLSPIRRTALVNPSEIPDEYWILDEKAISAHVKSMDGVISIPQVDAYDLNKS